MASLPHLLFALLFALNWWQGIGWLAVTLGLILSTAIYGWWRGRPVWLFPWLGYSLIPVIVAGVLLIYLPLGWSWLAIVVYVPLALWLICFVAIQTIKRDWLYIALTLLPIPIIIGWFLAVAEEGQLLVLSLDQIQQSARWIGLSFLALGATVAAFIRLRQRWLKVTLLVVSGFLTLIMVACYARGRLSLPAFLVLNLVMLGLLLAPALLERRLRRSRGQPTT
jgi:MFS family permease